MQKMKTFIYTFLLVLWTSEAFASYPIDRNIDISLNKEKNDFLEDWGPKKNLSMNAEGLGFDGSVRSSRSGWILSKPIAVSLYHKTISSIRMTVTLEGEFGKFHDNGMDVISYPGNIYVRYSPDRVNWTSWMHTNSPINNKYAKGIIKNDKFSYMLSVPKRNRQAYREYLKKYTDLGLQTKSQNGHEGLVLWILEQDSDFFKKEMPFIGYVQILYEQDFQGGKRLKNIHVHFGIGVSGLSIFPLNNRAELFDTYWRIHELR